MTRQALSVLLGSLLLSLSAFATDGNDWRRATADSRLQEVQRILGNIRAKGCTVRRSPEYYVRQLNDFFQSSATRSMELAQALALIATGAGEDWKC